MIWYKDKKIDLFIDELIGEKNKNSWKLSPIACAQVYKK